MENINVCSKFIGAIQESGMIPPSHIEIGGIHRFSDNGGRKKDGWYAFHINADGSAGGAYGNHKGIHETWFSGHNGKPISQAQKRHIGEEIQKAKAKAENERRAMQDRAAIVAERQWSRAKPAKADHPYLVKKKVSPVNIRQIGKALIIPLLDRNKNIRSREFIYPNGDKRFLKNGQKKGCFWFFGKPREAKMAYVGEGVATCITIYEATGVPVIVAFDAGNIKPVCETIREMLPDIKLVIAADNDISTPWNPGKTKAEQAAATLGLSVTIPEREGDFNDLVSRDGLSLPEVKKQLDGNIYKPDVKTVEAVKKGKKSNLDKFLELNKKHAVVMLGGKVVVMNESRDPVSNQPQITFSSIQDFKHWYKNQKIMIPNDEGDPIRFQLANAWLDSKIRRQYSGIVFEPDGAPDDYYNLWRGFAVEPKQGDWRLFQDHLFEVICSGNDDHMEYLLTWMADCVQNPGGDRPGVSMVLRGTRGCGKGAFVSNFGQIFGSHFLQINNQRHLTGNFNQHLKDCLLLFADEAFWAGDRSAEGVIKGLITEPGILIEPKGKDSFMIKNHVRIIMASNNEWVVPAGFEERRFFVLDVSDKRVGNRDYFNKLFALMNNGGREAMLHDLVQYPIDLDLRTAPRTGGLLDQVSQSMDSVQAFWFDCLVAGVTDPKDSEWPEYIPISDLYDLYVRHAEKRGVRYREGVQQFCQELKKLCPGIEKKRPRTTTGNRPRCYFIPWLDECRENFEKVMGITVPWSNDDEK